MRITSIFRAVSAAFVLAAAVGASDTTIASNESLAAHPAQLQQSAKAGVYDGALDQAAKRAWY